MTRLVELILTGFLEALIPVFGFWFILDYWNKKRPMSDYSRSETEEEVCKRAALCVWLVSAIVIIYLLWNRKEFSN